MRPERPGVWGEEGLVRLAVIFIPSLFKIEFIFTEVGTFTDLFLPVVFVFVVIVGKMVHLVQ